MFPHLANNVPRLERCIDFWRRDLLKNVNWVLYKRETNFKVNIDENTEST